jgi:hypothetical protein
VPPGAATIDRPDGDELAAAGAEQPDRAALVPVDADGAAELLAATSAGAALGHKLGLELVDGDALLLLEPAVAGRNRL